MSEPPGTPRPTALAFALCLAAIPALVPFPVHAQTPEALVPVVAARGALPVPARGAVTNLPIPRFVSMRGDTANARRGPGLSHRVDWEFVRRGMPLEVTAEYGQWRRVRDADGAGGWVHHTLLSGVRTVLVRTVAIVPLHSGPNDSSAVRAYVEPGVIAAFDRCEADYCLIEIAGTGGWTPRAGLWGVGPDDGP